MRSFADLGFVDGRKKASVKPTIPWSVFLAICKEGHFRPSQYAQFGEAFSVKKTIESVRGNLQKAFGIGGDPFRAYTRKGGWRAGFLVAASGA